MCIIILSLIIIISRCILVRRSEPIIIKPEAIHTYVAPTMHTILYFNFFLMTYTYIAGDELKFFYDVIRTYSSDNAHYSTGENRQVYRFDCQPQSNVSPSSSDSQQFACSCWPKHTKHSPSITCPYTPVCSYILSES